MSQRSQTHAEDPLSGRHPTSHERRTGLPWNASYDNGPAPWDIGRPQRAILRLASEAGFVGTVLDAGCGTGENALAIASLGCSVLGVDVASTVDFTMADAFRLDRLGRKFTTVLDCGLFPHFRQRRATSIRGKPCIGNRSQWNTLRVVL